MKIILRIVSKLASALLQALVSVLRLHHCATSDPDGPDQRHLSQSIHECPTHYVGHVGTVLIT